MSILTFLLGKVGSSKKAMDLKFVRGVKPTHCTFMCNFKQFNLKCFEILQDKFVLCRFNHSFKRGLLFYKNYLLEILPKVY